jgi:hypothetical protein
MGIIPTPQPDQQREQQTPAQRSIVGQAAYRQYIAGYDAPKTESTPASEREQGDEYDPN